MFFVIQPKVGVGEPEEQIFTESVSTTDDNLPGEYPDQPDYPAKLQQVRLTRLCSVTQLSEFNLLKTEIQIQLELTLESADNQQREQPTRQFLNLSVKNLEISEEEIMMMDFDFGFSQKFGVYEKQRLQTKTPQKL